MTRDLLDVGSRVQDSDGFKATIRYKGQVAASKNKEEIWLGVEWDDKSRGKHDGSCVENGIIHRYFSCSVGAGSFIKPTKIQTGKSFYEGLQMRYVSFDAPEVAGADSMLPGLFVSTSKGNQKPIEFVGEMKIRKYQQISSINKVMLRNESISFCGLNAKELIGHLLEVDIQDNLLSQWSEVFNILDQTPLLESMLLHGNKLQQFTPEVAATLKPHGSLRRLAMNATGASGWSNIERLGTMFPNLEELYLADNDMRDLPFILDESDDNSCTSTHATGSETAAHSFVTGFTSVRVLDLTGCGVDEWAQVQSLGRLPCLAELLLDENPLSRIFAPVETSGNVHFAQLRRLSLSSTKIASWTDINMLSTYPALEQLRMSHIPLFVGMSASEARAMIVGRLMKLTVFNASVIKQRERRDSEKAYLRCVMREQNATVSSSGSKLSASNTECDLSTLLIAHPRYTELMSCYAEEMIVPSGRNDSTGPRNLASELITIKIINVTSSNVSPQEPSTEKRLPITLTVGKLREMLGQLYGLDPECHQLALRMDKDSIPIVLDDDDSSLGFYGAVDGSEIFINEI